MSLGVASVEPSASDATAPSRRRSPRVQLPALIPGLLVVGLSLVWAVHDGGTNRETWLWGGLATVALLAGASMLIGSQLRPTRSSTVAITLFALYVAWSFISITWAEDKGAALLGSDMALMYLIVFGLMSALPWTERGALLALLALAIGVGVTAVVLVARLALGGHVVSLFIDGRFAAPTGYFNSTGALFNTEAILAIALAARRDLPGPLRGLLLAFATAGLDLAIVVQSRGWLFTLPIVIVVVLVVSKDRLRLTAAAVLPILAATVDAHRLVRVYADAPATPLAHLGTVAARPALLLLFGVFVFGTVGAWIDNVRSVVLPTLTRRLVGTTLVVLGVAGALGVGLVISHGHLAHFVSRQWDGFSHEPTQNDGGSHFSEVGSGRYDMWRVSLDALRAHPIGGLGQNNFLDYYNLHRRTAEETAATHSIELRLLAHTGIVGFLLFIGCLISAIVAAVRGRRRGSAIAGVALVPFLVWFIHGSIDWFWEMPALSGPALGFLGVAGALGRIEPRGQVAAPAVAAESKRRWARALRWPIGLGSLVAATAIFAFPYLSARESSIGSNLASDHPAAALTAMRRAARLDPLDATPQLDAGWQALFLDRPGLASASFHRALTRDRETWVGWLGAALADSARGDRRAAKTEFQRAHRINRLDAAARVGLARVDSRRPLSYDQAIDLLSSPD